MKAESRNPPADWSSVDEPLARQVLHQGEIFLSAQLTVALAADQRATALAGIFITASTAVFGVAGALFTASSPRPDLAAAFIMVGVTMLTAVVFFVLALAPTTFKLTGNNPQAWWKPGLLSSPLVVAIGGETENYRDRIQFNNQVLRTNAIRLIWGLWLASASPILGLTVWFLRTLSL